MNQNLKREKILNLKIKELKRKLVTVTIKNTAFFILLMFEVFFLIYILYKNDIIPGFKKAPDQVFLVANIDKQITTKYIQDMIDKIDESIDDDNVKGLLVVMNSPGGSPSASEEMASYLQKINNKKPVKMYIDSIAASGGYYIASAIKPLYSNKNAIVGSIGVIMPHYNLKELADKIGISEDYVAAGKYKKPISFLKPIDKETKQYVIDHLIAPTYNNFIKTVAKNRDLNTSVVKEYAEGKIYIANDPRIQGVLIDKIAHLHEVKDMIKKEFSKDIGFEDISTDKKKFSLPFSAKFDVDAKDLLSEFTNQPPLK